MNLEDLEQLRDCCRDQEAFERIRKTWVAKHLARTAQLEQKNERQKSLLRVITKIRETLELEAVFKTTATEVRQLLNADRVGVFRFYPNSGWNDGEFVSEDLLPQYSSALAARIHDHCFGEHYAADYHRGRVQAIADIHAGQLSACYVEVLNSFQIRANLVVPLLLGSHLWGLLCVHQCAAPRQWQPDEVEFAQQIALQLGVALQQAELLEQTQRRATEAAEALEMLQKSQSQLIQNERMSSLGQLVAGIAHEINNPVNFIHGNLTHASRYAQNLIDLLALYQMEHPRPSQGLSDRLEEVDLDFLRVDFPKILSSMQLGADRIRQIVLSLRNFSRLDEAEMKAVDIHEGIDSTLMILQHRLKLRNDSTGIVVVKNYGNLPPVECYPGQLNQVFMNLLSNAIDALEESEGNRSQGSDLLEGNPPKSNSPKNNSLDAPLQITICTLIIPGNDQGSLSRAVIQIKDNGLGIPHALQSRLFTPFFTTKPIGKGTGLGLSISHQIVVERHGGDLQCYSQPGQGTEFWIDIPVQQSVHSVLKADVAASSVERCP
ncbi:MAG: GAF domain-containing sensor histidine kinase [Drouetiella hepatica Uher 2000/2452]|jgi:signal transduction histidine kinase|uniref:histidine kinase n=1 Tax=Drouetiella hepatica Uher 2000/2452 TaxID=904376 RepID=A0A951QEJ1_9CYAN|nr:GAF domain-containing sensor histidine kinase [Drouetiella hepatica Uher 2000/2452]